MSTIHLMIFRSIPETAPIEKRVGLFCRFVDVASELDPSIVSECARQALQWVEESFAGSLEKERLKWQICPVNQELVLPAMKEGFYRLLACYQLNLGVTFRTLLDNTLLIQNEGERQRALIDLLGNELSVRKETAVIEKIAVGYDKSRYFLRLARKLFCRSDKAGLSALESILETLPRDSRFLIEEVLPEIALMMQLFPDMRDSIFRSVVGYLRRQGSGGDVFCRFSILLEPICIKRAAILAYEDPCQKRMCERLISIAGNSCGDPVLCHLLLEVASDCAALIVLREERIEVFEKLALAYSALEESECLEAVFLIISEEISKIPIKTRKALYYARLAAIQCQNDPENGEYFAVKAYWLAIDPEWHDLGDIIEIAVVLQSSFSKYASRLILNAASKAQRPFQHLIKKYKNIRYRKIVETAAKLTKYYKPVMKILFNPKDKDILKLFEFASLIARHDNERSYELIGKLIQLVPYLNLSNETWIAIAEFIEPIDPRSATEIYENSYGLKPLIALSKLHPKYGPEYLEYALGQTFDPLEREAIFEAAVDLLAASSDQTVL